MCARHCAAQRVRHACSPPRKVRPPLAVERLDKGLLGFGNMLDRIAGRDIASMEGSGAAGGIAAAMAALLGAAYTAASIW